MTNFFMVPNEVFDLNLKPNSSLFYATYSNAVTNRTPVIRPYTPLQRPVQSPTTPLGKA